MIEEFKKIENLPELNYHCPVIEDGIVQMCYNKSGEKVLKDSEGWDEVLVYLEDNGLLPDAQ
jgi:hypothetical protein